MTGIWPFWPYMAGPAVRRIVMEAAEIEASCRARGVDFREVLGVYRATPAESLAEALEIVLRRPSALER